jgi:hypothetical protein
VAWQSAVAQRIFLAECMADFDGFVAKAVEPCAGDDTPVGRGERLTTSGRKTDALDRHGLPRVRLASYTLLESDA